MLPKIFPVTSHTDYVGFGSTFVAIKGMYEDGTQYITEAIEKGAIKIVIAQDVQLSDDISCIIQKNNVTVQRVDNTRASLAQLSSHAAGYPAEKLKIIGITGTKGKTTTAFILEHILREAGHKTALISTVHNAILDNEFVSSLTTPQPDYLHQFLKVCVEHDVTYVVMEVAAQALTLHRVDGIQFDGIIFTNFAQEHLEFYKTLNDYFKAKCSIFNQIKSNAPVIINADDVWHTKLKQNYSHVLTFGMTDIADFSGVLSDEMLHNLIILVKHANHLYRFSCMALAGKYNGYNILSAVSLALSLGIDSVTIAYALEILPSIPGRMEQYNLPNGAIAIIDYAHNPMSFEAVLSLLRSMTSHLIVLFGAGGDRDASRRSHMGKLAAEFADIVVLTTDNPRSEDPIKIIKDIKQGMSPEQKNTVIIEPDRKQAIEEAYKYSHFGSIIAVLGKGAEEYQMIGNVKHFFSDREVILQL